jgi:V8-like Glu-specific endopeptidase
MAQPVPHFLPADSENKILSPWKYMCLLESRFASGRLEIGTGYLIGSRTVLTAAHCVWVEGQELDYVTVSPCVFSIGTQIIRPIPPVVVPGDSCIFREEDYKNNPTNDQNASPFDYAVIQLPPSTPFELGNMGLAILEDRYLRGDAATPQLSLNLAGYPYNRATNSWGTLDVFTGAASNCDADFVYYPFQTVDGMSGSGLFYLYTDATGNNLPAIVGIHFYAPDSGGGQAIRITQSVYNDLLVWSAYQP